LFKIHFLSNIYIQRKQSTANVHTQCSDPHTAVVMRIT